MDGAPEPIQIELTEEQQQLIRRLSGQFAKVLELTPDPVNASAGAGRALQFRWRLSVATGIPRQVWDGAERRSTPDSDGASET